MDRTVANGTGNAGQYPAAVFELFENINTTPDDLLLWFHHVPYTHRLRGSGKTVIQHFYDAHYDGAATAQTFVPLWKSLEGKIDAERYSHVLHRQEYQAGHSLVWRDAICNFYRKMSGIEDDLGRVGSYSYRIEAEAMSLDGYEVVDARVPETASSEKAVALVGSEGRIEVVLEETNFVGGAARGTRKCRGKYDVAVNYFDIFGGKASWKLLINDELIGEWAGDAEDRLGHWPSEYLDGHSAMRVTFERIRLQTGDTIAVVGTGDGADKAAVDYLSILPLGIVD